MKNGFLQGVNLQSSPRKMLLMFGQLVSKVCKPGQHCEGVPGAASVNPSWSSPPNEVQASKPSKKEESLTEVSLWCIISGFVPCLVMKNSSKMSNSVN